MAAIDKIQLPGLWGTTAEIVKKTFADQMWMWYEEHKDDEVTSFKVWFLSVRVKVHHLYPLFITLFGVPSRS